MRVAVFGATGPVGFSVAKCLATKFTVRCIVQDQSHPNCQNLRALGVDICQTSPSDQNSMNKALQCTDACFAMTSTDLSDSKCEQNEVTEGLCIGRACLANNVNHVVFCTQMSVRGAIGLTARHMDAKAEIWSAMKDMGLKVTGVIVPITYESLLEQPYLPRRLDRNSYALDLPIGHISLYMMSSHDVGPIIMELIGSTKWLNKTLGICGDKRTVPEIAAILSTYCNGIMFQDSQCTITQWSDRNQFPGNHDIAAMFSFYVRVDQRANLDLSRQIYPAVQGFEQWVSGHVQDIKKALDYPNKPPKDPWSFL